MELKHIIATILYIAGFVLHAMGYETTFAWCWIIAMIIHWKFWLVMIGGFLLGMKLSGK